MFAAAAEGAHLTFYEAWTGALAYSLQLYFDFSGYSDMAIGAARMFGIKLPLNFNSPYKAVSIIDFWRRWHITLSNFLRDYLYIPLGGNRKGQLRRYTNLMITMLLGVCGTVQVGLLSLGWLTWNLFNYQPSMEFFPALTRA